MKRISLISLLLLLVVGFQSCTHNNGDIGPFFGTWKVTEITIDSQPEAAYQGNLFWAFQTSVINMRTVDPSTNLSSAESWGDWEEDGNTLHLNFSHTDDSHPTPGSSKYSPLPASHLPAGTSELSILSISSSDMRLSYTAPDGTVYGYSLKKWW